LTLIDNAHTTVQAVEEFRQTMSPKPRPLGVALSPSLMQSLFGKNFL